jgi:streptomycin 6-kinase
MKWLDGLPDTLREAVARCALVAVGPPFERDVSCSWVAPVVRSGGGRAVLKLGMPQMEALHEMDGLRFWDGDPTVRLLDADPALPAMLLERCEPGTPLLDRPEAEADVIVAGLLRRLWRQPLAPHPFRPLSAMLDHWSEETRAARARWPDAGLVEAGLRAFREFSRPSPDDVLLATDLHAGNVLRAEREAWLVIDPKPFVGDRAYDATQHLRNDLGRMAAAPMETIRRFSSLLEVDAERVRHWMFARLAAEPRKSWSRESTAIARILG